MKRVICFLVAVIAVFVLTGCCISHQWEEATCTTPKTCAKCGKTEGDPLGHTWKEATCIEPKTCSVCGETEGDPLGHKWVDATCTEPKICSVCGETEGEALGHEWVEATCTEPKTCSRCGETEGEALGHEWVEASCTEPKTCSVCGETEGKALGHKWEDATCTEPRTCSVCGETEGEPLGHQWINATCTEPKTCSVCGDTEGKPLGHEWVDATCTEPKTCSRCGETEGEALGHEWVEATCTEPMTCSRCGETEGQALGHKWVAATWDEPKTCLVCGATEGSAILDLDHYKTQDLINLSAAVAAILQERQQVDPFVVPVGSWTAGKHLNPGLYSVQLATEDGYNSIDITLSQFGNTTTRVLIDSPAAPFSHMVLQDGDVFNVLSDELALAEGICCPSYKEANIEAVKKDFTIYDDSELKELYNILMKKLANQELPDIILPGGIWVAGEDFPTGTYDVSAFVNDPYGHPSFKIYTESRRMVNSGGDLLTMSGFGSEPLEARNIDIQEGYIVIVEGTEAVLSHSDDNVFFGSKP